MPEIATQSEVCMCITRNLGTIIFLEIFPGKADGFDVLRLVKGLG